MLLTFKCLNEQQQEYQCIYKVGDDLRQDQLVIQLITLMDRLLRKVNLDLKLTPYKVLATGVDHGKILCMLVILTLADDRNGSIYPINAFSRNLILA